jgi:hypothetical protein
MDDDVRQTIFKYENLFHMFVKVLDRIPMKDKSKKNFVIPCKTLFDYFKAESKSVDINDKSECCKFIKDRVNQYIDILKTEIATFDRKFIQILDRFKKSEYYNIDDCMVQENTQTTSSQYDKPELQINIRSMTKLLPYKIHYNLHAEDYEYLCDYSFKESNLFDFIMELFKDINKTQSDTSNEWKYIQKELPYTFSLDANALEIAIHIDDQTVENHIILFNNQYILKLITEVVPFLENGNKDDVYELLCIEQFKMFYLLHPTLKEIIEMENVSDKFQLSDKLSKIGLDLVPDDKAYINMNTSDISYMNEYLELTKDKRLLIKTFFPYKKGTAFLKYEDFQNVKRCNTMQEICDTFGVSFYIVDKKIRIGTSKITILLFSTSVAGSKTKMYNVIKKNNHFIHLKFSEPKETPVYISFDEFRQNASASDDAVAGADSLVGVADTTAVSDVKLPPPCHTEDKVQGKKSRKVTFAPNAVDANDDKTPSKDNLSEIELCYEQYQLKYMQDYFVPSTFENALMGYLNEGILMYGVELVGETFVVFKRFQIAREPMKSQYQMVYNMVKQKPPIPTQLVSIKEMVRQNIILSIQDLWNIWINCVNNGSIRLIKRNDGYQTIEGFFCRECDVQKNDVYQQSGTAAVWDLKNLPYISLHQAQLMTPKQVCMIACLTSHWSVKTNEQNFKNLVENTLVPVDIDVLYNSNIRPTFTKMNNLTALQLLPFILKYGPVSRVNNNTSVPVVKCFEIDFFLQTLYMYVQWNAGKMEIDQLQETFQNIMSIDDGNFSYLIPTKYVKFIHVDTILPIFTTQFPPLPCYVQLNRGGKTNDNIIGILYSHDEQKDEYIIRQGVDVIVVKRSEFNFYDKSRLLPYPITFLNTSNAQIAQIAQTAQTAQTAQRTGEAVEYYAESDSYKIVELTFEGLSNEWRNMKWNVDFLWDDQTYICNRLAPSNLGEKIYLKDIQVDSNQKVTDSYCSLEEPYETPSIVDRTNNRPWFDLYHPSSRYCIMSLLQFMGVDTFMKQDQLSLIQKVVTKKKCLESSCILIQAAITIWTECITGKMSYSRSHIKDSLRDFLTNEQIGKLNLDQLDDSYPILQLILEKLYQNVKFHHLFYDLWSTTNGGGGDVNTEDHRKMVDNLQQKEFIPIENPNSIEKETNNNNDIDVFRKYPHTFKLFECFIESPEQCDVILNVFWHTHKWYTSIMNVTEACKFRDQTWKSLMITPQLVYNMPDIQQKRLMEKVGATTIDDIFSVSGCQPNERTTRLLTIVRFLDSLSLYG